MTQESGLGLTFTKSARGRSPLQELDFCLNRLFPKGKSWVFEYIQI